MPPILKPSLLFFQRRKKKKYHTSGAPECQKYWWGQALIRGNTNPWLRQCECMCQKLVETSLQVPMHSGGPESLEGEESMPF